MFCFKKVLILFFIIFSVSILAEPSSVVHLNSGPIVGMVENNIQTYLGIPYAAPPVGLLRWVEPQPVVSWEKTLQTVNYARACPQSNAPSDKISEDCLYLNIWAPVTQSKKPLPVMVWIHGGGFVEGAGSVPLYRGEKLAKQGVIVVTFNYRLGPFGFFAHHLLTQESPHHSSGDYGLLDQIAALKWVKQNISAFGGNQDNVTVFGESAGGASINLLMISPLAKNLFQRAIVESGTLAWSTRFLRKKRGEIVPAETMGAMISKNVGCDKAKDELSCLRSQNYESLMSAMEKDQDQLKMKLGGFVFNPVIDGYVIPVSPLKLYQERKQANIPVIIGSNKNEGTLFLKTTFPEINSVQLYKEYVGKTFGEYADKILQLFPVNNESDVVNALDKLMTFKWFQSTVIFIADVKVKKHQPVWIYYFTYQPSLQMAKLAYPKIQDDFLETLGVAHGLEMPYVFGNFDHGTMADETLSEDMIQYWTQFAKTGNPNGANNFFWPQYNVSGKKYLNFNIPLEVQNFRNNKAVALIRSEKVAKYFLLFFVF